jgi:hypothetical protein
MPQIIPFWIPSLYHPTIAYFLLDKFYLQIYLLLYFELHRKNDSLKSEADKFSTWTKFELFHKKGQWSIKCYNFISILNLNVSQSVKLYINGKKKKYYYKGFRFHFEFKKKKIYCPSIYNIYFSHNKVNMMLFRICVIMTFLY